MTLKKIREHEEAGLAGDEERLVGRSRADFTMRRARSTKTKTFCWNLAKKSILKKV
jgi:hypothetical protein